ncbi:MAG: BON domain-containing protein [Xanthomonadales bacterium]|nr:BON domain-containing protein [Gammaproteobacteria bacterium]MBT8055382.1 BON domain-containing protein [Gammaproteobacteria bacterium]NNL04717.1 BON domain-containing protein [Xanthomonadales bacterium]
MTHTHHQFFSAQRWAKTLIGLALVAMISACSSGVERRSLGTVIDDQTSEIRILDTLFDQPEFDERDHIKVETHNQTMLLAGEVSSAEKKALATRLASELKTVARVVNELAVMPAVETSGELSNSYITSKVNTRLLFSNPIEGSDTGRLKVITARRTVYLMGSVTRAEGEAVAEVVRRTRGVEKVVKVFDYIE